jgi:hypothetical protein
MTKSKRTHIGKRGRSAFLTQVAAREVKRLRMIKALEMATGSWKDEDHPELKHGSAAWVRKLRREAEDRFRRVSKR